MVPFQGVFVNTSGNESYTVRQAAILVMTILKLGGSVQKLIPPMCPACCQLDSGSG